MQTSYFAKYRGDKGCNIAAWPIKGFTGMLYPKLYPYWSFFSAYKDTMSQTPENFLQAQEAYTKEYYRMVLDRLDPKQVYNELKGYVLLCYEKPGDFCHRRLVADWIEKSIGIEVPEIV